MHTGHGIKEANLGIRSPFDTHLGGHIYKVSFAVESTLGIGGQLVQLFQQGQLLGLKGIAAGTEKVQRLAIPEEHRLLRFMYNELGAHVEILNGMLPYKGVVVPFVLDYACKAVVLDLFGLKPFRHVVYMIANGADVA